MPAERRSLLSSFWLFPAKGLPSFAPSAPGWSLTNTIFEPIKPLPKINFLFENFFFKAVCTCCRFVASAIVGKQVENYNHLSGVNFAHIQGVEERCVLLCTRVTNNVEDGQNWPAPKGNSKMADFFVAPSRSSVKLHLRRRAKQIISFLSFSTWL